MAGIFDDYEEDALRALIKKLTDARIQIATGGDVQVVQAEGRRMEFTRGNLDELRNLTQSAKLALSKITGDSTGQAISVRMVG